MARSNHWMKGKAASVVTREVELGRRQFERNLTEVAGELGVAYSAEVKAGLLLCDIVVTVESEQETVDRFRRYAVGLSAASDGDLGGGGGP